MTQCDSGGAGIAPRAVSRRQPGCWFRAPGSTWGAPPGSVDTKAGCSAPGTLHCVNSTESAARARHSVDAKAECLTPRTLLCVNSGEQPDKTGPPPTCQHANTPKDAKQTPQKTPKGARPITGPAPRRCVQELRVPTSGARPPRRSSQAKGGRWAARSRPGGAGRGRRLRCVRRIQLWQRRCVRAASAGR